jgi:xylan 1,4-beta-xylosidase
VTLRWEPVDEAIGYLVHRAGAPEGPFEPVDHRGGDVLAHPGPAYCDTTGEPGHRAWYALASLANEEGPPGRLSAPVEAEPSRAEAAPLDVTVRAGRGGGRLDRVWRMIGSEHLSQLLYEERTGGRAIGADFADALGLARVELGAQRVRAHAILHDELGVYREEGGEPRFDFRRVEEVYDRLLDIGLRPVVELSFMPRDLARDPDATVFEYRGIISPPRDWDRWAELNRRLAAHLVERYGLDEVARWGFEVWNEPNLEVFWSGTQEEYFRLYAEASRAIKAVDGRLRVGGPASAAAGWIGPFLDVVRVEDVPFDFLSTHTYSNLPLDVRRALAARGLGAVEVWWTEWGISPTHSAPVNDRPFGAPLVLHGLKSVQGRAEQLAYWVVSDHFEELGRPPRLFHGGFGLLTVGNLRKPRWWALALAEELGDELLDVELGGDGAGSLVDVWAARREDGTIDVLAWNGTLDQSKAEGSPLLGRRLRVRLEGVDASAYEASLARVDDGHSNVVRRWHAAADWPSEDEWETLARADRLHDERLPELPAELELPMPGIARLRLRPRHTGTMV